MHYAQRRSPSSNAIGIGLVVLLHLGVGYALFTGLGSQLKRVIINPMQVVIVPDKPVVEPPLPAPPKPADFELPKTIFVPPIEIARVPPTDAVPLANSTDAVPVNRDVAFNPPPAAHPDTVAGAKRLAGPALVYPARPLASGLEGWVDVQCDVDETGRTSQCAVIGHEGSNAFADAALPYVAAARYSPATHNGVPVTEPHHRFHIEFKLNN